MDLEARELAAGNCNLCKVIEKYVNLVIWTISRAEITLCTLIRIV